MGVEFSFSTHAHSTTQGPGAKELGGQGGDPGHSVPGDGVEGVMNTTDILLGFHKEHTCAPHAYARTP